MILVYSDQDLGMHVLWNQSCTFNVFQGDTEVDVFSTMEPPTPARALELTLDYFDGIHKEMQEAWA